MVKKNVGLYYNNIIIEKNNQTTLSLLKEHNKQHGEKTICHTNSQKHSQPITYQPQTQLFQLTFPQTQPNSVTSAQGTWEGFC